MRKRYTTAIIIFISCLILFNACEKEKILVISDEVKYQNAINDAMIADQNEISNQLIAITENNSYLTWNGTENDKKVLVVTWTKHPNRFPENFTGTNTWGEIWVTVVPEIEDWFKTNYSSKSDVVFRAEQLIGLPKNSAYTHFVELWVKPTDLWRPSPDNEVTDNSAQLDFPVSIDSSYQTWYNDNIIYSYYPKRYPWTRLGYTYDWGSETSEIGLSEFVIKKNAQITVNKVSDNKAFFNTVFK